MSMEGIPEGEITVPERKGGNLFVIDESSPETKKRRGDNAPVEKEKMPRGEIIDRLAADPEDTLGLEGLNNQLGFLQGALDRGHLDLAGYNEEIIALYMELTEKNSFWRKSLADALFDISLILNQIGNEELARTYANQLTDSEYEDRCY